MNRPIPWSSIKDELGRLFLFCDSVVSSFGFQDYSKSLLNVFKTNLRKEKLATLETVQGRFEDCHFQYRYDLIFSFHAWYYISTEPEVMNKLHNLLNPGGRALVVLHKKNNFVLELNPLRGNDPIEISADHLFEAAKPYFHAKLHNWVDYLPPNALFNNGEITERGRTMFKFMLDRESDLFSPSEIRIFNDHTNRFTDSNGNKFDFGIVELNRNAL